jgi:hypothetical protein
MDTRARFAAVALALAISIKVAPLFFVPYLAARKRFRVAGLTLASTVVLTLLPSAYFGWHGNLGLLHDWTKQEFGVVMTPGEPGIVGFPSQSLHSILMRYFTVVDYSKLNDSNYPRVNLGSFDPHMVELLWIGLAAAGYIGLLWLARRSAAEELVMHGIAFCALMMLQPFTQMGDLVMLVWPIAVGMAALRARAELPGWARAALIAAMGVMLFKPLVPGRSVQRLLQVIGADFVAASLLAAVLVRLCLRNESTAIAVRLQAILFKSAVSISSVAAALILALLLNDLPGLFLFLFLGAILVSAYVASRKAAVMAIALSALAVAYFFLPPVNSFAVERSALPLLGLFLGCAGTLTWITTEPF